MNRIPKVLIVGQGGRFNLEGFVSHGFSQLGWDVARLNIHEAISKFDTLNRNIGRIATRSYRIHTIIDNIAGLEAKIVASVRLESPDLLLVFKGELFPHQTARKIRQISDMKTVLWFPDDPRFFESLLSPLAPSFDLVVVSSKSTLPRLRALGVKNAIQLSFGCDPEFHRKTSTEKTMDLTFVGSYYPERARMLSKLTQFDLRIWGPNWNMPWIPRGLKRLVATDDSYGERYVEIMNQSRIMINIHHKTDSARFGKPNMKVFEASGCGTFLLTDNSPNLNESFIPRKELVCYDSPDTLADLAKLYLEREEDREQIAAAAQTRAYKDHTYLGRVAALLGDPRLRMS